MSVNPIRPRYASMIVVNLPELAKPSTNGVATDTRSRWTVRGGCPWRASKEQPGTWETRQGEASGGYGGWPQRIPGINNRPCGPVRESEGSIVVMTPGNAGRAKGPCLMHVDVRRREIRLSVEQPYSETEQAGKGRRPVQKIDQGAPILPKVSRLRQKLGEVET